MRSTFERRFIHPEFLGKSCARRDKNATKTSSTRSFVHHYLEIIIKLYFSILWYKQKYTPSHYYERWKLEKAFGIRVIVIRSYWFLFRNGLAKNGVSGGVC